MVANYRFDATSSKKENELKCLGFTGRIVAGIGKVLFFEIDGNNIFGKTDSFSTDKIIDIEFCEDQRIKFVNENGIKYFFKPVYINMKK